MTIGKSYKRFLALVLAATALAAVAGWFAAGQAQAVPNTVRVDPASVTAPPGVSFTVDIIADAPASGLGSWDLDVAYDDTVVSVTACTPHASGGCGFATSGNVDILGFVGVALTGEQTLATITFSAVGTEGQSSPVAITVNSFNDGTGTPTNPATTDGVINLEVASFLVLKDFSDNNTADVTVSLTCTDGTVTAVDNTASEADAADFTITGFAVGTTCTATETVPAGYTADETACATRSISAGGDVVCVITNTTTATFQVSKDFSDNNAAPVTIALTCTSGTVTEDDNTATEVPADTADFTVDGFATGATCTASETVPAGYTKDESACATVAIAATGALFSCTITNTLNVATFNVAKDFSDDATAVVTVALTCTSGTVVEDDNTATEVPADTADFTVSGFSDPGATCTATESAGLPAGYTKDESACATVAISPGGTSACTITNTTTATFQVVKDFSDNDTTDVTVALTCTTGTVTPVDNTASEADPADFTVDGFATGATCTATETAGLPAGYTKDESACATVGIAATGALFSCTITNTLNSASFQVSKDFTNVNTNDVTVSLVCTSGTVTVVDATANEGTPDTADFTIDGFTLGATCTATETVPTGYTANEAACATVGIAPAGTATCTITNTPFTLLAWNDNDCNGVVDVVDGQWLLSALLGSPISQTEPCPDMGGSMVPTPFLVTASWGDTDCSGATNVRDGQYLLSALLGSPISQTEPCPDAGLVDSVIPLP